MLIGPLAVLTINELLKGGGGMESLVMDEVWPILVEWVIIIKGLKNFVMLKS